MQAWFLCLLGSSFINESGLKRHIYPHLFNKPVDFGYEISLDMIINLLFIPVLFDSSTYKHSINDKTVDDTSGKTGQH